MSAELIGSYKRGTLRYVNDRTGRRAEKTWEIQGAATFLDALNAPGLPALEDALAEEPELKCDGISVDEIPDSVTGFYAATVSYSDASGGGVIIPPTAQSVTWTFATASQNVLVDIDGIPIGSRYFIWNPSVNVETQTPLLHEDAQLGADVLVPTIEFEVRKPIPSVFSASTIVALLGHCNAQNFTCDTNLFPPRTCLFVGCGARRTALLPLNQFELALRFIGGQSKFPIGIPRRNARNQTAYEPAFYPIGDGISFLFSARKADGNRAVTQEEISFAKPAKILVHRMYQEGDLNLLGVQ